MKVLWIVNIILPQVCRKIGRPIPLIGGWLVALLDSLSKTKNMHIGVATVFEGNELIQFEEEGILYYLIPRKKSLTKYDKSLEPYWRRICNSFSPDLIHLHGTEYSLGLACLNACPEYKYLVSIQGLVSVIARYYYAGIGIREILLNITFRDIIRFDTIINQRNEFIRRGILERKIINRADHITGRTKWDEVHATTINPNIKYHFCNDILQNVFYTSATHWQIESVEKHSIYVSQGFYPIKGLHVLLKAVQIVKKNFPDVKIYIAGLNVVKTESCREKIALSGFGKYLKRLIINLGLEDNMVFTGQLTPNEIINKLVHVHINICPSSIENSPNSLGEAQILGVPIIAAYGWWHSRYG